MNGRSLMEHWKIVRLEEIAGMRGGASFPKAYQGNTEGKYPFYKVSDMNIEGNETLMQASNNWVEEDTIGILRAKLFSKDTVIFPKVGAAVHTNKKRLLSCDSLVDNNVMGVTIQDCNLCIPYYLLYWFESVDLGDFSNPGPLPSITVTTVKNAKIPLPPVPEQRAIAHVLQTIQEAKATRQRELELERERKAALMDHLFSYGTKGEPRKETEIGEIPESWAVIKLGQLCRVFSGHGFKTKDYTQEGIPLIKIGNLQDGQVVINPSNDYMPESWQQKEQLQKFILKSRDILIALTGATTGKTAVVPPSLEGTFLNQRVGKIELISPNAEQDFILMVIKTRFFQEAIQQNILRSAQGNISPSSIAQIPISLPLLPEQRTIASVFQAIDEKTAALKEEVEYLDELFHATLDELMTGQRSAVPLIDSRFPN